MAPAEVSARSTVIEARNRLGIARHPQLCDYTRGMLSQPPMLFGLPPATVEESSCAARGDDVCLYTVSWDADAASAAAQEPQALITALEAQLVAMRDRLESMYAMASDLITLDDVDSSLARITERAASAVRAPTYLLAVRMGETLHVHSRGLAEDEADRLAEELLDGSGTLDADSQLVAEVASSQRRYGRIMAASPAGLLPASRVARGLWKLRGRGARLRNGVRRSASRARAVARAARALTGLRVRDDPRRGGAAAVRCDPVHGRLRPCRRVPLERGGGGPGLPGGDGCAGR